LLDTVRMSVVVVGLVPIGLFLAMSVAYALGAVRMARSGVLIQQANAIESLSHVDVLCLDKTGTLTTNQLILRQVVPLAFDDAQVRRWLGTYVASETGGNRTSAAIATACPGEARRVVIEVPFVAARKWSALVIDDPDMRGTFLLGAPEMLIPHLAPGVDGALLREQATAFAAQGLRTLLFGMAPEGALARDAQDEPTPPDTMQPLALVVLADELRPEAQQTLAAFIQVGITIKLISGDHPDTVAALARRAGLPPEGGVISGLDLDQLDDAAFAQAAADTMVFGRVAPQQKERLVQVLRRQGHYVAMIGDGVNDVLALKRAHLGIAMQSGSQATRNSADIVLLGDSFAPLPRAFLEGQRIRNGMENVMKLFLTRSLFVAIVILGVSVAADGFPFSPKQNAVLALLAGGIPALALVLWATTGQPNRTSLFPALARFVVPAGISLSLAGIGLYVGYILVLTHLTLSSHPTLTNDQAIQMATPLAQSALTTFAILGNLAMILFVAPPARGWSDGTLRHSDPRPAWLALGLLGLYVLLASVPALNRFFELGSLHLSDVAIISGITVLWTVALRWLWHTRMLERVVAGASDGAA
jgi:cation-transporting ATPase E